DTKNHRHFVIENDLGEIIAWAVDFLSQEERRFSIIVSSMEKGKGLGVLLINKLKEENDVIFGWVIDHNKDLKRNGELYQTPMPFYLKHGFEILSDQRLETEIISAVKIKWERKNDN
ncbi:MAG: GNAT family N-acetyltransferase, partial [Flavobacteriia bacterium]